MEYSPMLLFMLCALTPSEAHTSEGISARVEEIPPPLMSVQSFTFNNGKPFLAERDPLTGALDLRTTPINKGASDDYLYEEFEESGESVDRKDGLASQNVINPFSKSKEPDLHKFLNLPVHYASSGKYPLVSSSYANTKIQGHASNHRTSTSSTAQTPSTVAPSYYTHKTTPSTTVKKELSTTPPKTTPTTTTTTTTTTTPSPLYEYEYEYDYSDKPNKGDYEFLGESSEVTNNNNNNSSSFNSVNEVPRPFSEQTTKSEQNTTTTTTTTESSKDSELSSSENKNYVDKLPNYNKRPETTSNRGSIKYHSSSTEETTYDRPYKYDYHSTTTKEPANRPYNKYDYRSTSTEEPANRPYNKYDYRSTSTEEPANRPYNKYDYRSTSTEEPANRPYNKYDYRSTSTEDPSYRPNKYDFRSTSTEQPTNGPYKFEYHSTTTTENYPKASSNIRFTTHKPSTLDVVKSHTYAVVENKNDTSADKNEIIAPSKASFENNEENETKTEMPTSSTTTMTMTTTMKTIESSDSTETKNQYTRPQSEINNRQNITFTSPDKHSGYKHQNYNQPSVLLTPPQLTQQIPVKSSYGVSDSRPAIGGKPLQVQGNDANTQDLRPPPLSVENPMRLPPTGEQRPTGIGGSLRPSGNDNSYRPTGADSSQNIPQYVLRPPLRPHGAPPHSSLRPQGVESTNLRPQILHPHQQYQRPQEEVLRPHNVPQQQTGRPQDIELNRPPQLMHNKPHPSGPSHAEAHRPQGFDFSLLMNSNENKPTHQTTNENNRPQRPQDIESDYIKRPQTSHPIYAQRPEGFPQRQPESNNNRPFSRPIPNNEEVVWPATRPNLHKQPIPPYNFFVNKPNEKEQIKKKPLEPETVQGVGSVESVNLGQSSKVHVESVNIGQPSKVQSHFIKLSPGQDNPSYSLQTSFSIGVPPPSLTPAEATSSHIHFPQEEPVKKFPPRPQWEKKNSLKQRHPLPNILPQFRPNAKIGHAEPPLPSYVREPSDSLQPPPLPRPEFLRAEEPLVHRRNGQSHVTTLQMMQTPNRGNLRAEDKDEPVFVVYPSNGGEGVVVGTRGPQRPLPPDNLNLNEDVFPLENEDFKARVDTPILKGKPTKPLIKNEFPYPLIKPVPVPEEEEKKEEKVEKVKISTTSKEYTAFSPTVSTVEKENDAEINIIPYLQDYMPFATKKPLPKEPLWAVGSESKPISVTLNTKSTTPPPLPNHKQPDSGPTPLDFQAPFQASLTAPNRGWSVVKRTDNEIIPPSTPQTTTELSETTQDSVFDPQNFKPQLFGGFKPILPPDDIKPLNE